MKLLIQIIFLPFFFICTPPYLSAQNVNGKWYGIGNVDIPAGTNSYLCEFILTQKGNNVTGFFNYFFRDGYFSNKVKGSFDVRTRELQTKPVPILYYQTINAGTGVDCIMDGIFILKASKTESTLTGSFLSDAFHAYTAPPINIRFRKLLKKEPTLKERIQNKELVLEQDTIKEQPVVIKKEMETPKQKITREAEKQVQMRAKQVVRILDVTEDSVRIDLYDNGDFDHDTVSVFYNNKLSQYKQLLETREAIHFYVKVDSIETNNDLTMFAENLGTIPPNSALMIITDKDHRYEIPLTSNYQKNAAVRLRKLKTVK